MKDKIIHSAEGLLFLSVVLIIAILFYIKTNESKAQTQDTYIKNIKLPSENLIYMGDLKSDKTVYVFVDPLCPYCALEFFELKKLKGYKIAFILYPVHDRALPLSSAILCQKNNKDKLVLLEEAFLSQSFPDEIEKMIKQKCTTGDKLVKQNIHYAKKLNITVVPTLILPDGKVIKGYTQNKRISYVR